MQTATDEEIFEVAISEGRTIVSADTDFGTILALRSTAEPSVLIFRRSSGRRPEEQARLLLRQLPRIADALERGNVVMIKEDRQEFIGNSSQLGSVGALINLRRV